MNIGTYIIVNHYDSFTDATVLDRSNPCAGCSLQTNWGSTDELTVVTDNIFAIWWYPQFDHADDANILMEKFIEVRNDCLDNLGMSDPPNPGQGFFYNIYIHHGENDPFPSGWGMGQGTDPFGLPYLTVGFQYGLPTIYHEAFHIFQYVANSPGKEC